MATSSTLSSITPWPPSSRVPAVTVLYSIKPPTLCQLKEASHERGGGPSSAAAEKQRGGPEAIKTIMKQSTGEDGMLSLKSLSRELEKEGVAEPSAEQIIGQAELGGMLIRSGPDSWSWL